VPTYDVAFRGGPCHGQERRMFFLVVPPGLHCGGDIYSRIRQPLGYPLVYEWTQQSSEEIAAGVLVRRDVRRAWRALMRAKVRHAQTVQAASARARARMRRAVR
jgi:hypothetical protein